MRRQIFFSRGVMLLPIAAAFLLILPPFALVAQTDDDLWRYPLSNENRSRLNELCGTLSPHKIIRGDFVQTFSLNRLGRSLVSRGMFAMDAERGIIWDTTIPYPSTTAVGKNFVVQKSGGEAVRLDASGNEIAVRIAGAMVAVFSGGAKKLKQTFDLYFSENGKSWNLGLVPKDRAAKKLLRDIVLRGNSVLREVILREHDGDTIRYELSRLSCPAALSADEEACFTP